MFEEYEEHLEGLNCKIQSLEQKCIEKDSHIAILVEALRTIPQSMMSGSRGVYYCPSCERVWDQRNQMSQPHKENCALYRATRIPTAKTAFQIWKQRLSDQYQKGIEHCRRRHDQLPPQNVMVSNEAQERLDRQIREYHEAEQRLENERRLLMKERLSIKRKAVNNDAEF